MNGEFDLATAVRDLGDGSYAATVTHGWDIGGNANGGFLLAIGGRAMADASAVPAHGDRPLPRARHPPGRASSTSTWCATAAGWRRRTRRCARTVVTCSACSGRSGTRPRTARRSSTGAPPELPPLDECVVPRAPTDDFAPVLFDRLAVRLRPVTTGSGSGSRRGAPRSPAGSRSPTPNRSTPSPCCFVADAFPPPVFNTSLPVALGADPRADRARARRAVAGPVAVRLPQPLHPGRADRGGRRDVGLAGRAGGAEPPAVTRSPAPAV